MILTASPFIKIGVFGQRLRPRNQVAPQERDKNADKAGSRAAGKAKGSRVLELDMEGSVMHEVNFAQVALALHIPVMQNKYISVVNGWKMAWHLPHTLLTALVPTFARLACWPCSPLSWCYP